MKLGAVFAGGQARRFGADKALAELNGRPLLSHVIDRLKPQVDRLVVVGRNWPGCVMLHDRPEGGLGPLAALAAALAHASDQGGTDVLTSGCDLPDLPHDLAERLGAGPAVVAGQPLLGLWPAALLPTLDDHLRAGHRSMRSWIEATPTREVAIGRPVTNINRPADLAAFRLSAGPRSSP